MKADPPIESIFICAGEADTASLGARLATSLLPGDAVLLSGDMGAGKSVMARSIARKLGVTEPMPSPTFLIMIPHIGLAGLTVYHMDLFRLDDADAFTQSGLDECLGGYGIALIEWPERCPGAYDKAARVVDVRLCYGSCESERRVEISVKEPNHADTRP